MREIERRIDALEKQLGHESNLLIVGVRAYESDDDAIKREAATQHLTLADVAAAVLFCNFAPPVPPPEGEEERIEWPQKYCGDPIRTVYLRPHTAAEQTALKARIRAMVEDAIKRLAAKDHERQRAVVRDRNPET